MPAHNANVHAQIGCESFQFNRLTTQDNSEAIDFFGNFVDAP